ncbi:MAG TPA: hypothetical protein PLP61_06940 [Nocardioides sp.]|uniref:hypothetical protein n=1 Tax=Nocardioides sp. TaxID=35761 RepID=UPI002B80926C|nr:hypothetical protein [Nocardioides sp.]HQR26760.1 hypothetical protein [Nocardioides sp.]
MDTRQVSFHGTLRVEAELDLADALDLDHAVAAGAGVTCPCGLAPLCRRHHRVKTHTAWTYHALEPGSCLWTSPHGYQYLRDHEGTLDVSADRRSRPQPCLAGGGPGP